MGDIDTYTYGAAEVTKDSIGQYHKDIEMVRRGQLWYRYEGSGNVVSVEESYIVVDDSEFD